MLQCNVYFMQKILTDIEIGKRLKMLRKRAGLTQEQLSELIGVSSHQVQKYERGSDKLSTYRLQQVSHILSVPIQTLFSDLESQPICEQEAILIEAFRKIKDRELQENVFKVVLSVSNNS